MVALLHPNDASDRSDARTSRRGTCRAGSVTSGRTSSSTSPDRGHLRLVVDNTDHQASAGPDRPLLLLLVAVGLVVFGLLFGVRVLQGGPPAEATVVGNLSVAEPVPIPGDVVVVAQPGDSLWSIAQSIAPDSDPRPVVAALIEANGGDSVRIGQEIVIPQQLLD